MKRLLAIPLTLAIVFGAFAQNDTSTDRQLAKLRKKATEEVYKAFREFSAARTKLDSRLAAARRLGLDIRLTADTLMLDTLLVSRDTTGIVSRAQDNFIDPMPAPVMEPPVFLPVNSGGKKKTDNKKGVEAPAGEPQATASPENDAEKAPTPDELAAEAEQYYLGDGRPQDYHKAFTLYQQGADGGSVNGMFGVAVCYLEGHGTDRNYPAAVKWLTKAADKGDTDAMYLLAQCYERGRGVPENVRRAVTLYRKAASKGNAMASEYLRKIGY